MGYKVWDYEALEITEEEKEALKSYCGWEHSYINLLINGEMEQISKHNNEKLNIFSKDYFTSRMETLKNIYAVMTKYAYKNPGSTTTLHRGTTKAEVDYLISNNGWYNKLLSTSTSLDVAKQHAGSKVIMGAEQSDYQSVIMYINLKGENIPYINVNSVLEQESNFEDEREILISPFGQLEGIRHYSTWDGYDYYSADIKGEQLEPVANTEELLDQILEEIEEIPDIVKTYIDKENEYEILKRRAKTDLDKELIYRAMEENFNERSSMSKRFASIRSKMLQYAKGICYETKLEIENNLNQEKEERKTKTQEKYILMFKEILNQTNTEIGGAIQTIQLNSDKYLQIAKILNLDWETSVLPETMAELQKKIQASTEEIVREMDSDKEFEDKKEYIKQKNFIGNYVVLIRKISDKYNDSNCMEQISSELNLKVEGLIKKSKLQDLDNEIEELQEQKIGILGKILGKRKEQELNIEQLSLKRRLLELEPTESKPGITVSEIYANILYYQSQRNGELPDELICVVEQMNKAFDIDKREIARLVAEKSQERGLIEIETKNPVSAKRKTLKEINERLAVEIEEIEQNHTANFRAQNTYTERATDIPQRVYEVMNRIYESLINEQEQLKSYEQE